MKVIDLLVKIANGEEVPKKIKYRKCIFEYEENFKDYFTKNGVIPTTFDSNGIFRNIFALYNTSLNDEVEIINENNNLHLHRNVLFETETINFLQNIFEKLEKIIDYLEENK